MQQKLKPLPLALELGCKKSLKLLNESVKKNNEKNSIYINIYYF